MSMDGPMVSLVILSGVLKYTSLFVYFWMKYIYIYNSSMTILEPDKTDTET
jgi:hypothetical protein